MHALSSSEAPVGEEGGYTPFSFVHFASQEIVHDIEVSWQEYRWVLSDYGRRITPHNTTCPYGCIKYTICV